MYHFDLRGFYVIVITMKIVAAHIVKRFKIHLLFESNVSGIIDFSDLAGRGVFASWMEPGIFEQMELTSTAFFYGQENSISARIVSICN